jgi:hypothetical protein
MPYNLSEFEHTRRPLTIQGTEVKVIAPYSAGHTLSDTEALVLNQVFGENVRNNLAKRIAECYTTTEDEGNGSLKELKNGWTVDKIQTEIVDPYMEEYEWYARGPRSAMDPVEKHARQLCTTQVREAVKSAGKKLPVEQLDELIEKNFTKNRDSYMSLAKELQEAAKQRATATPVELD